MQNSTNPLCGQIKRSRPNEFDIIDKVLIDHSSLFWKALQAGTQIYTCIYLICVQCIYTVWIHGVCVQINHA